MAVIPSQTAQLRPRIIAGVIAALIGGMLMAMFEMLYSTLVAQTGPLIPPNMIALLAGYDLHTGFGIHTVVGFTIHLVFSAFLGLLWGIALPKTLSANVALLGGLVYGLLIYVVMFYWITPLISPTFAEMGQGAPMVLGHLIFGAAFVLYPWLVDSVSHRRMVR